VFHITSEWCIYLYTPVTMNHFEVWKENDLKNFTI
jgi:hypothetical protein